VTGAGANIGAAKHEIRRMILAAREAMTPDDRVSAGAALARHGLDRWVGRTRVAAYLDVGTEPPTRPLLDDLAATGCEIVVPVVSGEELDWVRYQPGGDVTTGALGVDEPTGERLGPTALRAAEVILVPALAVDRHGNRLGRGRGYYDRALASVTTPVVAITYDDELVESVPVEPHDRQVQAVLRPAGYVPC
jgi:5-formyltetrahydrofolate cyclo-ligase